MTNSDNTPTTPTDNAKRNKAPSEIILRGWVPWERWLQGRFKRVHTSAEVLETILEWQGEGTPVVIVTFLYEKTSG